MTQNAINNTASIMAIDNITIDGNTISSTDTDGNVIIAPDGSGTVSVTTAPIVPTGDRADSLGSATNSWDNVYADGVTFDDGTNIIANFVDTTDWTPVLEFGGASAGITYSAQIGKYTRIGNLVFFHFQINLTSKGSSTGAVTITGLPLASIGSIAVTNALGLYSALTTDAATRIPFWRVAASTIDIRQSSVAGSSHIAIDNTNFANTTAIVANGTYITT